MLSPLDTSTYSSPLGGAANLKLKQTITKLLALLGGIKKLTLSGTVGVTLCRRNCHVNPNKIETCFRAFPKFKLINAPHLYLTQIGVG